MAGSRQYTGAVYDGQALPGRAMGEKQRNVLEWIHRGACDHWHVRIQSVRNRGTGQWVFETSQFQQWMNNESRVLLVFGMPSAGKTFLSSAVIDHLLQMQNRQGVAYLYFRFTSRTQRSPIEVFSVFTKQLLSQLPGFPPDIEEAYGKKWAESLDLEMLKRFLFSMPMRFSNLRPSRRAFIVCDGVDYAWRKGQGAALFPLFHEMADAGFDIFLTSLPDPDVRHSFASAIKLEIADQNDLRKDICTSPPIDSCQRAMDRKSCQSPVENR